MTGELWQPTEQDAWRGAEAYIHYIGGVILLHDPESEVSQGIIGQAWREAAVTDEEVIVQAEDIMYKGLRVMISMANPPEFRRPISRAEHRHEQALPHIRAMVSHVCEQEARRLDSINPAIRSMRPMPLTDPATYTYICHGRRQKISTRRLLDVFMPAPVFMERLADRALSAPVRHHRAASGDRD